MPDQSETTTLTDEQVGKALSFVFDVARPQWTDIGYVWGVPLVFRVLTNAEVQTADTIADRVGDSPGAQSLERAQQMLARSILKIGERDFGSSPLEERDQELHDWPEPLTWACAEQYRAVRAAFDALLRPASLGESSGAAGVTGER